MLNKTDEINKNLCQIFLDRTARFGGRPALLFKDRKGGVYHSISWTSWREQVIFTASGLAALGIKKGDRIGILSENRPEWTYADFGALSLGAVTVPIYPTSSPGDASYIIENAGVELLFISSNEQLGRLREVLRTLLQLKVVIVFDGVSEQSDHHLKILSLASLLEDGKKLHSQNEARYNSVVNTVEPNDIATLIYTSGTTGPPKGVILTHGNFIANYLGASEVIHVREGDVSLSFLPLCHVFERLAGYYFMTFHGAQIAYAESMQTVPQDLITVRPTVAASVPRLYEKIYGRIMETVSKASPLRQKVFFWAMSVAKEKRAHEGHFSPVFKVKYALAKILVFRKLKNSLGGRIRFFISGGAPLSKDIAEFFYSADVLILEGYGLTETSPVITVNAEKNFRFGTVGKPLSNIQIKIAQDGEILTAGPCVMKGYYHDENATAEAMKDGWFHTGDIGEISSDGFLKITDRKKDIIVTSGGKNISPQNIESIIVKDPLFSQIVVIGDKRNYISALIVPNKEDILSIARKKGIGTAWPEVLRDAAIYSEVEERLRILTAGLSRYEQIKYFALLDREFSQEKGELTPTLKIKRKVIMKNYEGIIDGLYRKGEESKRARGPETGGAHDE